MNKRLLFDPSFIHELGWFFGAWATFDLVTDFAIGKFLNASPEDTHLITAGMVWGRKARLLADLIKRSSHPNKAELKRALGVIQGHAKRDMLAHSYMRSDATTVTFVHRQAGSGYCATELTFTLESFRKHVKTFTQASVDFNNALGPPAPAEMSAFASASLSLNSKSSKSPG
jgi:hypothetical protein